MFSIPNPNPNPSVSPSLQINLFPRISWKIISKSPILLYDTLFEITYFVWFAIYGDVSLIVFYFLTLLLLLTYSLDRYLY